MTALLKRALDEAKVLPESEQDFLAALLLENIRDAQHWDTQFAASKDVLEELYDEAMEEYQQGRTIPVKA